MPIVCGIDFSPPSLKAAEIAGRMAKKLGTTLAVAHVVEVHEDPLFRRVEEEMDNAARIALAREGERMKAAGVQGQTHLLHGKPDQELAKLAERNGAELVVISALGTRAREWQVGGSADRIVQICTTPVLMLRDEAPFDEWLDGKRPLKALVGWDRTHTPAGILNLLQLLRRVGPVDITLLHLYWATDEYRRLGMRGLRSIVDRDPEVERIIKREIRREMGELPGEGALEVKVDVCFGRPSDRITAAAEEQKHDLLIVGSHKRNLVDRLWSGSTSRAVLHRARSSVAVVTAPASGKAALPIPRLRSVLVATDFSEVGDAAIRWAYAMVEEGGKVYIVNVHAPEGVQSPLRPTDILAGGSTPEERAHLQALETELARREPDEARERGITTEVHAVVASHASTGILQAAERLGVDALVLGTRGRTGLKRAVLGSVAQAVATSSSRPVLLVGSGSH